MQSCHRSSACPPFRAVDSHAQALLPSCAGCRLTPSGKGGSGSETLSSGVRTQVQRAPDLLEAQSPPPKARRQNCSHGLSISLFADFSGAPRIARHPQAPRFVDFVRFFSTLETRWRRGWDSNPRGTFIPAGFQDRCLQPLGHPSKPDKSVVSVPGVLPRKPRLSTLLKIARRLKDLETRPSGS